MSAIHALRACGETSHSPVGPVRIGSLLFKDERTASLYDPWLAPTGWERRILPVERYPETLDQAETMDVVVFHEYWQPDICRVAMDLVRRGKVPVLMLPDGILEYRCVWEYPSMGQGIGYMPVPAHKIACLGAAHARVLESWGNEGRCESVGLPRLDGFAAAGSNPLVGNEDSARRILVATARAPGFTEPQWQLSEASLCEVRQWFDRHPTWEGQRLLPVWRVARRLQDALALPLESWAGEGASLADVLCAVDAVITTPSTLLLEAMLKDKPVALLDYHNKPQYVPAAWNIAHAGQIDDVVAGMLNRDAHRLWFQRHVLHDHLAADDGAAARMQTLVSRMANIGAECRAAGREVAFPPAVLQPDRLRSVDVRQVNSLHGADGGFQGEAIMRERDHYRTLCSAYQAQNARLRNQLRALQRGIGPFRSWLLYRIYRWLKP